MSFLDFAFNRKLKKFLSQEIEPGLYLAFGQRGSGKSTLYALIAQINYKQLPVYSNYGIDNTYKLPYKLQTIRDKQGRVTDTKLVFDKETLYNYNFKDCFILIDEGKTIWPNRDIKAWTAKDDNFINFLRKNNVVLLIATQDYEGLDKNLRKACNLYFYMRRSRFFRNVTNIEMYNSEILPVTDRELEVRSGLFKKPFNLMSFQVGAMLNSKFCFYRKPYYSFFDTNEIIELDKKAPPALLHDNRSYSDDWGNYNND